jgi:ubiquinone/menaquinone biosynthesis C-methylase UbiE
MSGAGERASGMVEGGREQLRTTFNQAAELYDRVRPGYPARLVADLTDLAGIGPGSRVLEIGCGTGQLTLPLAERGCEIVALDIGADMVTLARGKLAHCRSVQLIVAAFEDWPLPARPFDAVVSATAFHWLDPAVRVRRAAEALRPGGVLATIATHHVAGDDHGFFADVQACYERWDPMSPKGVRLPAPAEVPLDSPRSSTAPAGSGPPPSGATSGTNPTRRGSTASCCSPIQATGHSRRRRCAASSTASPA